MVHNTDNKQLHRNYQTHKFPIYFEVAFKIDGTATLYGLKIFIIFFLFPIITQEILFYGIMNLILTYH